MESKTCQVASCMVPKFKLNWAVEDDRNNIKNTLMETILDTVKQCNMGHMVNLGHFREISIYAIKHH